jgi:simple sugar transport system substrate-binding protein
VFDNHSSSRSLKALVNHRWAKTKLGATFVAVGLVAALTTSSLSAGASATVRPPLTHQGALGSERFNSSYILPGGKSLAGKTFVLAFGVAPGQPFDVPLINGAKAAAALLGVNLDITYGGGEDATTVSNFATSVAQHVAGIAAQVLDTAENKVLCEAYKANIPVIAVNDSGETGPAQNCVLAFVGQDFVSAGAALANYMVTQGLIKPGASGFCPVEFAADAYAVQRYQGVMQVLSKIHATCSLLSTGTDLATAKSDMIEYMLGHRSTAFILALGGTPLQETPAVLASLKTHIPAGGFDLSDPVLQAIQNGTIAAAVDQQPYSQGFYGIMQLGLYVKYDLFPSSMGTGGTGLITKSNIGVVLGLVPTYR